MLISTEHKRNSQSLASLPFLCHCPNEEGFEATFLDLILKSNIQQPYNGGTRLGLYYQWLVSETLKASSSYQVLAEELQIIQSGRTIGALDFLLHNQRSNQIEHWEVAIKFYLHYQGKWLGPNAHDQLDKKYHHMRDKQLGLTLHPAYKEQYGEKLGRAQKHRLIMQGILFHHIDESPPPLPQWINPNVYQACWAYYDQVTPSQWQKLDKMQWIAPPLFTGSNLQLSDDVKPAQCINQGGERLFIMPRTWPRVTFQQ
ncbi:DUF1853 family protein [Thaumasiovibrio sp. DFM-14]|uniref:DUF1853 family protein n=1 Tax=Thaumasiovibrio sp. DFM-14 TaxID=3384792 RepID=UPI0039A0536E